MTASSSSASASSYSLSLPQPQILLSTTGTSTSPGTLCLVSLSNPSLTSPLLSLKPYQSASQHAVSIVPPSAATNSEGLLASLENGKNLLHLHSIPLLPGLTPSTTRFIPPQRLSCLALSPDGSLLCAGALDGHAYLWQVASGRLLASWEPHFRSVTVIKWDSRAEVVATGGEDGRVCVWSTSALADYTTADSAASTSSPLPYATFSTHLLPITSLAFSPASGVFPAKLRLWSTSSDGTVKLWDLRTRTLITNFQIADGTGRAEVTCLAADPTGRFCFIGVSNGRLYRIDLYRRIGGMATAGGGWEARGGGGMEDVEKIGDDHNGEQAGSKDQSGIQLSSPASSLALLPSSSHLLIGTTSPPTLQILDVRSLQIIRTTPLSDGSTSTGSVSNLLAFHRPTVPGKGGARGGVKVPAKRRVVTEQLERSVKRAGHEGVENEQEDLHWCEVPSGEEGQPTLDYLIPPSLLLLQQRRDQTRFSKSPFSTLTPPYQPSQSSANARRDATTTTTTTTTTYDLQTQVDSLKRQLAQAEKWNKEMWKAVVKKEIDGVGGTTKGNGVGAGVGAGADEEEDSDEEEKV